MERRLPPPRSLRVLSILLRIGITLAAIGALVGVAYAASIPAGITDLERERGSSVEEGPAGEDCIRLCLPEAHEFVELNGRVDGPTRELPNDLVRIEYQVVSYATNNNATGVLLGAVWAFQSAAVTFVLWKLWVVVDDTIAGRPLRRENATRLRVAGLVLTLVPLAELLVAVMLRDRLRREVSWVDFDFSLLDWWPSVAVGLGLIAMSMIFERAVDLHELEASTI